MAKPSDLQELGDDELVARIRESDRSDLRPFDMLVQRYEERVVTNCRHISGSPADAPDLAQEVFLKAYFAIGKLESGAAFGAWIGRIKVNHCLNFLKKVKGKDFVDIQDPVVQMEEQVWVRPAQERDVQRGDDREAIGRILGLDRGAVSVKASSGNLAGDEGAGRSISARVVATLRAAS